MAPIWVGGTRRCGRSPWNEPRIEIENASGVNHQVSNIAAMKIPSSFFGPNLLQAGEIVQIEITLCTHAGASEHRWAGRFPLSN